MTFVHYLADVLLLHLFQRHHLSAGIHGILQHSDKVVVIPWFGHEIHSTAFQSLYRKLHIGICGEHGGDPASVEFCNKIGLDYVSCSPFRVPIARLAAAQAAIQNKDDKASIEDKVSEALKVAGEKANEAGKKASEACNKAKDVALDVASQAGVELNKLGKEALKVGKEVAKASVAGAKAGWKEAKKTYNDLKSDEK